MGDFQLGPDSHLLCLRLVIWVSYLLFEYSNVKEYIFKFVRLQAICKSKLAAFKCFVNKIIINHTGSVFRLAYQHGFPNHFKNNVDGKASRRHIRTYIVLYVG